MADGPVRWISVTQQVGCIFPHDEFRDVFVRFSSVEGFSNQERVAGQRVTFDAKDRNQRLANHADAATVRSPYRDPSPPATCNAVFLERVREI